MLEQNYYKFKCTVGNMSSDLFTFCIHRQNSPHNRAVHFYVGEALAASLDLQVFIVPFSVFYNILF